MKGIGRDWFLFRTGERDGGRGVFTICCLRLEMGKQRALGSGMRGWRVGWFDGAWDVARG